MPGYSDLVRADSLVGTAVQVVGKKCTLMAARSFNLTAADAFVLLYDASTTGDVTVGTTIADWAIEAAGNDLSAGDGLPSGGLMFQNGIVAVSLDAVTGTTGATQHLRLGVQ